MALIEIKPHRNGWKVFEAPRFPFCPALCLDMCYVSEDHYATVNRRGKMPSVLRLRYRNLKYPSHDYTIYHCSMRGIIFRTGCDCPCARASRKPKKPTAAIVSEPTGSDRSGYAKVGQRD